MMENGIYLTISSDAAIKQNEENTHSSFFSVIETPLFIETPSVIGLNEVFYHPSTKVFNSTEDNKMILHKSEEVFAIFNLIKQHDISSDITIFNMNSQKTGMKILLYQTVRKGKIFYGIQSEYGSKTAIRLSKDFQSALNFNYDYYDREKVEAENSYDPTFYRSLKPGHSISFEVVKLPEKYELILEEPDEADLVSLVTSINACLVEKNILDFLFVADDEQNVTIDNGNPLYRIYPSPVLTRILALKGKFIDNNFESNDVDLFRGNNMLVINCNITAPQILNGKRHRILRVIEHNRTKQRTHLTFDPVYFGELERQQLDSIQIEILNESGQYIQFTKPFTCVLQIKSI